MKTKESFQNSLYQAISETYENMAFMEVLETDDHSNVGECNNFRRVEISFNGNVTGIIIAQVPVDLISQMVEALNDISLEDQNDSVVNDMLCEISNTFVGRFLTDTVADNQSYAMGLPRILDNKELENNNNSWTYHYIVEEEFPIAISMKLDEA